MSKIASHVFYINLDKNVSRGNHCLQLLKDIGFETIERIIPIDKNDPELLNSEKDCVCSYNKSAFKNLIYQVLIEYEVNIIIRFKLLKV